MFKKEKVIQECDHRKTVVLKSWRKNKAYGKFRAYGLPIKCTEVCKKCSKRLRRWKL